MNKEERQRISLNLERIIRKKGYLKGAVAKKAGFTPKHFSDILHGRRAFHIEYVVPICDALDISPNELFEK